MQQYPMCRALAIISVLLIISSGCTVGQPAATQALPREVTVLTVAAERPSSSFLTSGSFTYKQISTLSFETPGRIQEILVQENQRVAQGELLALLDAADYLQQARLAETQLQQAKIRLQQAENGATAELLSIARSQLREAQLAHSDVQDQYRRYLSLFAEGGISERQLRDAETALATVEQKVVQAQANLDSVQQGATEQELALLKLAVSQGQLQLSLAEQQLAKTRLTAPAAGEVIRKTAHIGEMAAPGHPVLVLGDELIFTFGASAAQLPVVNTGNKLSIMLTELAGAPAVSGTISSVSALPDSATRLYTVEARIEAPQAGQIKAGMIGQVSLDVMASAEVLLLPVAAVVSKNNRQLVFTIGEDNRAQAIEITVGRLLNGHLEILSGLTGGEKVIVDGAAFLQDGEEVRIQEGVLP